MYPLHVAVETDLHSAEQKRSTAENLKERMAMDMVRMQTQAGIKDKEIERLTTMLTSEREKHKTALQQAREQAEDKLRMAANTQHDASSSSAWAATVKELTDSTATQWAAQLDKERISHQTQMADAAQRFKTEMNRSNTLSKIVDDQTAKQRDLERTITRQGGIIEEGKTILRRNQQVMQTVRCRCLPISSLARRRPSTRVCPSKPPLPYQFPLQVIQKIMEPVIESLRLEYQRDQTGGGQASSSGSSASPTPLDPPITVRDLAHRIHEAYKEVKAMMQD